MSVHKSRSALVAALLLAAGAERLSACGQELWALKTATDADASLIDNTPVRVDVSTLSALPRPRRRGGRRSGAELVVWAVRGRVTRLRRERDGDLHLIIRDEAGSTMVAEVPDPACASGSRFAGKMADARKSINRRDRVVGSSVVVYGVGFFDRLHGQVDAAPNGLELHPVLAITWISDN